MSVSERARRQRSRVEESQNKYQCKVSMHAKRIFFEFGWQCGERSSRWLLCFHHCFCSVRFLGPAFVCSKPFLSSLLLLPFQCLSFSSSYSTSSPSSLSLYCSSLCFLGLAGLNMTKTGVLLLLLDKQTRVVKGDYNNSLFLLFLILPFRDRRCFWCVERHVYFNIACCVAHVSLSPPLPSPRSVLFLST